VNRFTARLAKTASDLCSAAEAAVGDSDEEEEEDTMKRISRLHSARLATGLFVFLVWCLGPSFAQAYAPVDDLIVSVNQLLQSNQIFNDTIARDLIDTLQTAGTMVDQGNKGTATALLMAFKQQVNNLSGDLMTPTAASQLVQKATETQSGL
jgi:hypothetical protein